MISGFVNSPVGGSDSIDFWPAGFSTFILIINLSHNNMFLISGHCLVNKDPENPSISSIILYVQEVLIHFI